MSWMWEEEGPLVLKNEAAPSQARFLQGLGSTRQGASHRHGHPGRSLSSFLGVSKGTASPATSAARSEPTWTCGAHGIPGNSGFSKEKKPRDSHRGMPLAWGLLGTIGHATAGPAQSPQHGQR